MCDQYQMQVFPSWNKSWQNNVFLVFQSENFEKDQQKLKVHHKLLMQKHHNSIWSLSMIYKNQIAFCNQSPLEIQVWKIEKKSFFSPKTRQQPRKKSLNNPRTYLHY